MIALIQRVSAAKVEVDRQIVGRIDRGICVFVGVQQDDCDANMERLVNRTLGYRIFDDASGRMNRSVVDVQAGVLIVSQFTLAADTDSGLRASYTPAAPAQLARSVFDAFVARAHSLHSQVATGIFGADMQVTLCNDGPVSFILQG